MYADQNSNVYFHSKDAVFLQATSLSFFRSHGRAFKSILHVSSSLFLKHFIYDFWLCFSLVVESRSYSLVEVRGLLIVVALLLWSISCRCISSTVVAHLGSVATPQHVESSWTRDRTLVPCIGRQIPNHWATRKSSMVFK